MYTAQENIGARYECTKRIWIWTPEPHYSDHNVYNTWRYNRHASDITPQKAGCLSSSGRAQPRLSCASSVLGPINHFPSHRESKANESLQVITSHEQMAFNTRLNVITSQANEPQTNESLQYMCRRLRNNTAHTAVRTADDAPWATSQSTLSLVMRVGGVTTSRYHVHLGLLQIRTSTISLAIPAFFHRVQSIRKPNRWTHNYKKKHTNAITPPDHHMETNSINK